MALVCRGRPVDDRVREEAHPARRRSARRRRRLRARARGGRAGCCRRAGGRRRPRSRRRRGSLGAGRHRLAGRRALGRRGARRLRRRDERAVRVEPLGLGRIELEHERRIPRLQRQDAAPDEGGIRPLHLVEPGDDRRQPGPPAPCRSGWAGRCRRSSGTPAGRRPWRPDCRRDRGRRARRARGCGSSCIGPTLSSGRKRRGTIGAWARHVEVVAGRRRAERVVLGPLDIVGPSPCRPGRSPAGGSLRPRARRSARAPRSIEQVYAAAVVWVTTRPMTTAATATTTAPRSRLRYRSKNDFCSMRRTRSRRPARGLPDGPVLPVRCPGRLEPRSSRPGVTPCSRFGHASSVAVAGFVGVLARPGDARSRVCVVPVWRQ